jgi:hypothetical protein
MPTNSTIYSEKEILPFVEFFNRNLQVLLFEYFANPVVGTCQTCFSCLYFHETLAWIPLQTITVIQGDIKLKALSLGNGDESDKKSYLHFLLQMISLKISLSIVLKF